MAKVVVQAGLDASGFKTGLQHLSAEGERFSAELNRKFSAGKIFGSILSGIGIGTGFAAAQAIFEKMAASWSDAADDAQRMERSTEDTLATTRKILALRQNTAQQLAAAETELRDAETDAAAANEKKSGQSLMSKIFGGLVIGGPPMEQTKEDKEAAAEAEKKVNAQRFVVAQLKKRKEDEDLKHSDDFLSKTHADDKARAEAKGLDYDEFNHMAVPKKKTTEAQVGKRSDDFHESISADSLAKIGGGGNVNTIGPLNPLLAETKIQTGVLKQMLTVLINNVGGKHGVDIRR